MILEAVQGHHEGRRTVPRESRTATKRFEVVLRLWERCPGCLLRWTVPVECSVREPTISIQAWSKF